jgi:hypothetical protein
MIELYLHDLFECVCKDGIVQRIIEEVILKHHYKLGGHDNVIVCKITNYNGALLMPKYRVSIKEN